MNTLEKAMDTVIDSLDEPMPPWAVGLCESYMEVGAQLCTRDGRRMGNAFVSSVEAGVATCITDMGNVFRFTESELESAFYPPEWKMDVSEATINRLDSLDEYEMHNAGWVKCERVESVLKDIERIKSKASNKWCQFDRLATNAMQKGQTAKSKKLRRMALANFDIYKMASRIEESLEKLASKDYIWSTIPF
ncbi:hypothetical protein R50073_24300 [Maricurvus nonylphenolicus]|uniref:hypothetical protein n=1 Tax=Maricurvus nonylphenolicus TaxID=1008307 RepID=UPI0036F33474